MIEISNKNDLLDQHQQAYSIIYCNAQWCAPCKQLKPIINNLAETRSKQFDFFALDIENGVEFATELGVLGVPTIIIYDNKQQSVADRKVGPDTSENLNKILDTYQ